VVYPNLSIVVCTRNRGHYLLNTLRAYENISTNLIWELIIVDNGSTDSTPKVLAEFLSNTVILAYVVSEPHPGLSRARNAGWRQAAASIVVFSDDDCYPQPDFVDAVWNNFAESPLDYLGGRILLHDPMDFPITIQTRESRLILPPGTFIESGLIHGANMAFRKEVLQTLGGFDELLGAGTRLPASDDTDLISRASVAGYRGAYDPRPVVFHHHRRRTQEQVAALQRAYAIGRGAHYAKSVLDPIRRKQASRQWYWCTVLPAFNSKQNALQLYHEIVGAFRYFAARAGL
jgi:glycosyltransferase involved in cell wall biosynthesis